MNLFPMYRWSIRFFIFLSTLSPLVPRIPSGSILVYIDDALYCSDYLSWEFLGLVRCGYSLLGWLLFEFDCGLFGFDCELETGKH